MGRRNKRTALSPYRSKYEAEVAADLTRKRVGFDYESEKVTYLRPIRNGECQVCAATDVGQVATYTPDFVLKNGIYIEAKGKFDSRGRTKILAVLQSNNVITRENFRLLFMRDNYTTASRRETYTDWCARHNIVCAIGPKVPQSWVK